jgi:DnaJ-class molecular chaperone
MKGRKMKKICSVCNGNGFVRIPYDQVKEEQWADCEFCNNQGEVEVEEDDDTVRKVEH